MLNFENSTSNERIFGCSKTESPHLLGKNEKGCITIFMRIFEISHRFRTHHKLTNSSIFFQSYVCTVPSSTHESFRFCNRNIKDPASFIVVINAMNKSNNVSARMWIKTISWDFPFSGNFHIKFVIFGPEVFLPLTSMTLFELFAGSWVTASSRMTAFTPVRFITSANCCSHV